MQNLFTKVGAIPINGDQKSDGLSDDLSDGLSCGALVRDGLECGGQSCGVLGRGGALRDAVLDVSFQDAGGNESKNESIHSLQ